MEKIIFEDLPSTKTPLNADNLNQIQENVENAIIEVDDKVKEINDKNIYSLEEIKTNEKWIDGKSVYKITIEHSISTGSSQLNVSNLNIETLIDYNTICERINIDSNEDYEKPYYISDTDYYRNFFRKSTNTIETRLQNNYANNIERITLKYTKKVD